MLQVSTSAQGLNMVSRVGLRAIHCRNMIGLHAGLLTLYGSNGNLYAVDWLSLV